MTHQEFIDKIAASVQKYAKQYGILVHSPIIAQAILESGWGTSAKAKYHNYFGLKYRKGRVSCNNGYFEDGGSEQNSDGTYTQLPSTTAWYSFETLDLGVKGYFEFTNIANYSNLKGVTDPKQYLENIKKDGYATSLKYVDNVYNVIIKNDLTKYDTIQPTTENTTTITTELYRVRKSWSEASTQKGAFKDLNNAKKCADSNAGYSVFDSKGNLIYTKSVNNNTEKENSTMSNSSLVTYTKLTKNCSSPRNHAIDTITIHCIVGQWTAKQGCDYFASTDRQCSSNYVVGKDGSIGLSVEEKNRSWCSSNSTNDNRAITIEVASDTSEPYAVTDKAYSALIELVADICKRNGIKSLKWSTSKSDRVNHSNGCNMTVHRDFAAKSCPGTYLYERHGDIAAKVNAKLGATTSTETTTGNTSTNSGTSSSTIKVGSIVKIASGATYYTGKSIPSWVTAKNWKVTSVSGDRVVLGSSEDGKNNINSPVNSKYLSVVGSNSSFKSYLVKINTSVLNVRKGPGTNYAVVTTVKKNEIYTIVGEENGWGKLKSGVGYISLSYTKKV